MISIAFFVQSEYNKGWNKGYKAGWCHEIPNCIEPIPPIAPVPKTECPRGYKCGYNRGFVTALEDRSER